MRTNSSRGFPAAASVGAEPGTRPRERTLPQGASLDRWLAKRALRAAGNPAVEFVLSDGQEISTSAAAPMAQLRFRDRGTLLRLVLDPELHFGDDYSAGRIDVQGDLLTFLQEVYRTSSQAEAGARLAGSVVAWLRRPRRNTLAGSRENIHHHYDLGNEFYRLWLDEQMLYTCAYFPSPEATLEEAQVAKMRHVCRKLCLQTDETVAEAGCGWGALALYMARECGVRVRAFNVSHEQIAWARERAKAEGLANRVEFVEDDYRNIAGRYDAFVSVGMLEHVGRQNYRDLSRVIHRCLKPDGRGLLHSIGRNRPARLHRWIERRIFPGAYPPSLGEMVALFEPDEFSVLDVENLRLHYAKTLEHWLERFEANVDRVRATFDERFVRAWRLYLAGSIAGFTTGSLQLFQVLFTRAQHNAIPWTRDHLYA